MGGDLLTVVFVDVEGSTELLVERGDVEAGATLRSVLDAVRERLEPYGGREVKSLGDGLMLVFPAPRQAVTFAVSVQRALVGHHPPVRIGVNTGEVSGSLDDPVGEAVTAAARIAAKAAGREVLVSDVVRQLVGTIPGVRFLDRGRARLKGFPERWRLHAAAGSEAATEAEPIFGRESELAALHLLLQQLLTGNGGVVVLEGEAGIGKSHLASAAIETAAATGIRILRAGSDELSPDHAGKLVLDLAVALSIPVDRFTDDLGVLGGSRGFALGEAVAAAIEGASTHAPVLLVLEDLQWADELSLRTVTSLARRIAPLRVGIVATTRPSPRPPLLDRLVATATGGGSARVVLDGLPEAAVTALVASSTGLPPGPKLAGRVAGAGGNPLYVIELLRALEESGELQANGGVVEVADDALPATLRTTVLSRLSALPADSMEVLRLASLLGREFTLVDLAAVAGRSVVEVASRLRPALDAAVLSGAGDTLSFRHDLIRDAVYDDVLPAIRRDLHAAAGRALAAAGAPVRQVARQMELGARTGDLVAVDWLERAAVEALALDHGAAVTVLEHALAIAGDDWSGRDRLQAALVGPLASSGRVDDALALAERMLERGVDDEHRFVVNRALAAAAASAGDLTAAADAARAAAEVSGAPPEGVAALRCLEANLSLLVDRTTEEVHAAGESALGAAAALGEGNGELACVAHHTLAMTNGVTGRYDAAIDHARSAGRLQERCGIPSHGFLIPDVWEASFLCFADRFDDALAAYDTARIRAERRGYLILLVQTHVSMGYVHFLAGRWDDALAELEAGLDVTEDTGNHAHDVGYNALLARIAFGRGHEEEAGRRLAAGHEALAKGRHLFGVDLLLWVTAGALERQGDDPGALAAAVAAWDGSAALRGLVAYRQLGPMLARFATHHAMPERAAEVRLAMDDLATRTTAPSAAAAALRVRGTIDDDADMLLQAVATYRDSPRAIERADACEDAARALFRADRATEAAAVLDEAAAVHRDAGAAADLARVDALLREHGIRRRRSAAAKTSHGWDALSPTERTIVELVATGMSNPQIGGQLYISRRTVETHLSHVFRKLDVTNRAQLAAAVAARAGSP